MDTWSQYPGKVLKYSFKYEEKILSNYTNLLKRSESEGFNKYKNLYSGFLLISSEMNKDFYIQFYLKNLYEPAVKKDTAAGYSPVKEIRVFVNRNHSSGLIHEICYAVFPGNEMDLVIKNILASIQFFKTSSFYNKNPVIEDFPDGRFRVTYQIRKSWTAGKQNVILVKKMKSWYMERGQNLGKTIIDSFFCKGSYGMKDSVLKNFDLLEVKHQKLGQTILAYIETKLNVAIQEDATEKDHVYPIHSGQDNLTCVTLYKTFTREERHRMISRHVLENTSLDEIKNEIQNIIGNDYSQYHTLVSKLRAALFLYPDFFTSIEMIMDTADKQSLQFEILMTAVLSAENIPAQRWLASQLENNLQNYSRLRPMLAQIGVMTYVTDSTLFEVLNKLLYSTSPNISAAAGLTISNLANQYKYYDPYRHQIANEILFNHYQATEKNHTNLLQYIKEIGNAGDESKVDFLLNCLKQNDDISDEALYSCRFVLSEKLDTAIAGLMRKHVHDSILNEHIYEVIQLRYPSFIIRNGIYSMFRNNVNIDWPVKERYINYLSAYVDEIPLIQKEIKELRFNKGKLNKSIDDLIDKKMGVNQFDE